ADPTLEWFPTLAYRQSLTTIQGREWIDGEGFDNLYAGVQLLQNCITEESAPLECIEIQASKLNFDYDYIYIAKKTYDENKSIIRGDGLILNLSKEIIKYKEVYQSDNIMIYKYTP
ncbi:MAG: hypothetical protein HN922_04215, partial [Anaerolineae bacterium]|nr:hypothetical protein [Anaerolineae bacterium]